MKSIPSKQALTCAIAAARAAGTVMRQNLRSTRKKINLSTRHDIKLELDVRCQRLIERTLLARFPETPILGEEGVHGDVTSGYRWVVDPIDGTVNFTYGIPHACVSIALQQREEAPASPKSKRADDGFKTLLGVVYDPFCDELWTAIRGRRARLNGSVIHVSRRDTLGEAIVSLGFAKHRHTLQKMLPTFNVLMHRVRKIRIMGAAALALVYVATGRMDAYIEYGLRLWDIAAGGLIVECAGGEFWHQPVRGAYTYRIHANNGLLRRKLEQAR